GGTLFLDEVGDMSPMTQAKLLRVLQDGTFERVGGTGMIKADVRVIAATNHNLQELVDEGQFRKDLFYRLSVVTIKLPPLRERGDDLKLLAEHFLRRYSPEFARIISSVSPEALQSLRSYSWPGNVRELESVIKQSLLKARGSILLPEFLPTLGGPKPELSDPIDADLDSFIDQRLSAGSTELYSETIACAERHLLQKVLEQTKGNQVQASAILGISRVTLRNRIRSLDINVEQFM
ncbi:MAG: sigma-54-dependent Fis family transcriptional regulator, partial [Planctomycetaceae bacterium]|nr:sigma-54-dependent Fis family transcriptional regulator [Planctomycetaceae bacterium]